MVVNVAEAVKNPGVEVSFDLAEDMVSMEIAGECLRFHEPVRVGGNYVSTGENIMIGGTIHATYTVSCARCLADCQFSMDIDFREEFAKTEDDNHPDRYLYQGEEIDLDQMVTDQIILQMPMRHLCKPNCRGLCPVCGADRNLVDCRCPVVDPEGE